MFQQGIRVEERALARPGSREPLLWPPLCGERGKEEAKALTMVVRVSTRDMRAATSGEI